MAQDEASATNAANKNRATAEASVSPLTIADRSGSLGGTP